MLNLQLRQLASSSARHYRPAWCTLRLYSNSEPLKASMKLVAELRKRTDIPISKAREALLATNNDLESAMQWLEKDLAVSGAKKAEKVGGRETKEGLIGLSLLAPGYGHGTGAVRASMIELNCETDFVARNDMFSKLAADIAHSTAFHAEEPNDFQDNPTLMRPLSVDALLDAPFLPKNPSFDLSSPSASIGSAIRDTIAKIGENISLRRAVSVVLPSAPDAMLAGMRVASYAHGSTTDPSLGRLGTLALVYLKSPNLKKLFASDAFPSDLAKLERALARQISGFDTRSIRLVGNSAETALYEQPFMLFPGEYNGQSVKSVLQTWAEQKGLIDNAQPNEYQGIAVSEFARWSVGQDLSSERVVSTLKDEMDTIDPQSA
ncbi:hypothetical protein EW145_g3925 [Phellinidium pouzarii]|uniref:Elongation factor Ts, mitochondrial n=1 Tax=Phellinidium pouzarii TaxID=167371 RepID=A0A4S4L6T4_9AGAM|nr:hypothetical protein EW145_g3925 [Phellinidium pouzarii]